MIDYLVAYLLGLATPMIFRWLVYPRIQEYIINISDHWKEEKRKSAKKKL